MAQARYYSSLTHRTTTTADPGVSGATLTVADTASFASLDGSYPYTILINWGQADQEVVNVTARSSGTTFTIVRGQDGTSGQAHAAGATVDHGVSARDFTEAGAHVGASTGVHGVAGAVVGTTDTQTLSGKTFTTPTIGSFVNAAHDHHDAASGGLIRSDPTIITNGGSLTCTTSYQNIPNLSVTLTAGATYRFQVNFMWRSSGGTGATFMAAMGGTVTPSKLWYRIDPQVSTSGVAGSRVDNTLSNTSLAISGGAGQADTDYAVILSGVIVVGSSGTLTAVARHGTATAVVQSGGMFILERIA